MKIIITGSVGNISKPLTNELVQKGNIVTVISSKPEKQKDIEALGAKAAIGNLEDVDFLTTTFACADAVYTMVPPSNFFDHNLDLKMYYTGIATNYAEALSQSGIKRLVHLSSIGADLDNGSGFIMGHHNAEVILNKLTNIAITFVRPAAFYANLFSFINVIKNTGNIAANYGDEDKVPWVSPIDIAAVIAEEISSPVGRKKIRYVASDELSCRQAASILGEAIGKPDLKWITISNEEMQNGLNVIGMNPQIAASVVETNASIHNGLLFKEYHRNKPALGQVKLTSFAKEFASAFYRDKK